MTIKLLILVSLFFPSIAFAIASDVTTDDWYSTAVSSFVDKGFLPDNVPFRAGDAATRGEFMELVVRALGGVLHALPTQPSFDDVRRDNPSFQYFEEAAVSGWMKGVGNCLGKHPCYAKPDSPINRAEAATILLRAFNLEGGESAPGFPDNPNGQWYTTSIFVAGSNCMLKGDAATGRVRPEQNMNRAEMVVMLKRLDEKLSYPNCDAVDTTAKAKSTTPKTTTAPLLTQDPLFSSLTSRVTQMGTIEQKLYDTAVVYKGSSFQTNLFALATQYTALLAEIKTFLTTAKTRPLTKTEWDRVNTIQDDTAAIGDRFMKVQDAALQAPKVTRSQTDIDALRRMIDLSNSGFKQYASAKSLVDSSFVERINEQLKFWNTIITKYEKFLSTALDRALTDSEGKTIEGLQQQELSIVNTLNDILEEAKMYRGGSDSTYTPAPPPSYSNAQYCEDVKLSLGISGGWRSSQKVKEAGRKLLDAGCISSATACSDYQVCN